MKHRTRTRLGITFAILTATTWPGVLVAQDKPVANATTCGNGYIKTIGVRANVTPNYFIAIGDATTAVYVNDKESDRENQNFASQQATLRAAFLAHLPVKIVSTTFCDGANAANIQIIVCTDGPVCQ